MKCFLNIACRIGGPILMGFILGCTGYTTSNFKGKNIEASMKASDFYDSGAGNSLSEDQNLFDYSTQDGEPVLSTSSTLTNIHSHLVSGAVYSNFSFSGSMLITDKNGGIGFTFLSQYPNSDSYYRVRRYKGSSAFHVNNHGSSACNGDSLGVVPAANKWYSFSVITEVTDSETSFTVKVWPKGDDPTKYAGVSCVDSSSSRFLEGTVGVWAMGPGSKYWTDFKFSFNPFGGDAGDTDSGSTDPGSTDPGSTDSGSTDSGSTDSGSTDSGSTDSGSSHDGSVGTINPPTPPSSGIRVSNSSQLSAALNSASGGEVILLASGNYGNLDVSNKNYSKTVLMVSENGQAGAKFSGMLITNVSNLTIQNVHLDSPSNGGAGGAFARIDSSNQVTLSYSEINGKVDTIYAGSYGIQLRNNCNNIHILNNSIHDIADGIVAFGGSGHVIQGNIIEHIEVDGMKFGSVSDVLIENNIGPRFRHPPPDAHKDFIQFQASSNNVTIRGNVSLPGYEIVNQGIFIDDGVYNNFVIENNVLYTGNLRGISLSAGSNNIVRYNTVLTPPTWGGKASIISVVGAIISEKNVIGHNSNNSGISGSNHTIQYTSSSKGMYYNSYYKNATAGTGITIQDLEPVPGSPADGQVGAFARIRQLLGK